jgi:transposase
MLSKSLAVVPERHFTAIFYLTFLAVLCILSAGTRGIATSSPEARIMKIELLDRRIVGPAGELVVPSDDDITPRLIMLLEGECDGLGAAEAAKKHGLTRQRYYQLLKLFKARGALALQTQKRGPKTNYVRTDELERQVIRHRFLDPDASVDIIAQKLRQAGFPVSVRSVARVIEDYGLQKKTLSLPPQV